MRERIQERLEELRGELEAGKRAQAELEARQQTLTHTMLRIGGAIQVLQEMLATAGPTGTGEPNPAGRDPGAEVQPHSPAGDAGIRRIAVR
jgi:hypothetical protein